MNQEKAVLKLNELAKNNKPGYKEGMARAGIKCDSALGVCLPDIRKFAKEIGKDHKLAMELWNVDIHEAKFLAALIAEPAKLTENQMDGWVNDFYSWDICDTCCGNLFDRTSFYGRKINEYVKNEKEFVRRTGFVLMATSAVHDKKAPNEQFLAYLPKIKLYSYDERKFVKKSVNWALRQIGKRNIALHSPALKLAKELKESKDKTARWIGSDAARELENPKTKQRLAKKTQTK